MSKREEIGRVEGIQMGWEDHGIFTLLIHIRFNSAHQGYGGFILDEPIDPDDRSKGRRPKPELGAFLYAIHEFFGLSLGSLERVKDVPVIAELEGVNAGTRILRLRRLDVDGGGVLDFHALLPDPDQV